jgi:hypothetical protein
MGERLSSRLPEFNPAELRVIARLDDETLKLSAWGHKQTFTPSLGQVRFAPRKRTSIGAVGMHIQCSKKRYSIWLGSLSTRPVVKWYASKLLAPQAIRPPVEANSRHASIVGTACPPA